MHDFHLAEKISKLVWEEAAKNNLKKVKKIVIELGTIVEHQQPIKASNLKFNLGLLFKNTPAAKARIIIKKIKGNKWVLKSIEGI